MWRNPTDVAVDHLQYTQFGQFFAILAILQPLWCHTEAPEEPKSLVKVPFEFQEKRGELYRSEKEAPNIEIWLFRDVPTFWASQLLDFWDDVRAPHSCLRATVEVSEEPPAHARHTSLYRSWKNGFNVAGRAIRDSDFLRKPWSPLQCR